MASRSLCAQYESLRAKHRSKLAESKRDDTSVLVEIDPPAVPPPSSSDAKQPEWITISDGVRSDISAVRSALQRLSRLQAERLKISFDNDSSSEQDEEINAMVTSITRLLKRAEAGILKVSKGGEGGVARLSQQERIIRANVMRSLGLEVQEQNKQFRLQQKEFLKQRTHNENLGKEFALDDESGNLVDLEKAADQGLTAEQVQQLEQIKRDASERDQAIIKLAESINELHNMYKQLNVLIIEQGTVLDRIDYNVDQALIKVREGNEHLKKAQVESDKAYSTKCILILVAVVAVLTLIMIIKKSI